jgi:F-type H+-transporting ATPase subunit delta
VKDVSVAARYTRALYIITERRGDTVAALEDLKSVRDLLSPGSAVSAFLASPQVRQPDKHALLASALEGRTLRSVAIFADLLLRKKRLDLLAIISHEFEAMVERKQGIRRAHVVSAVALDEADRARLLAALERTTHSKIKLTSEVDASLLGGALVRMGDRVVDRTVRTLLEAIDYQLHQVAV